MRGPIRGDAPSLRESDGPWLIRSHYWNCWHRRNKDGGASGYTDDIEQAGVFDFAKAREYNDWPTGRDEAVPVSRAIVALEARYAELSDQRDALANTIARARTALLGNRKDGSSPLNPKAPDHG